MKYLLLIYGPSAQDALKPEDGPMWDRFNATLAERGYLLGAAPLERASGAKTVRVTGGALLVTDGPFAETKEQLAGYYLVDCADEAEALELASQIPAAAAGSATIEVRRVWDGSAG